MHANGHAIQFVKQLGANLRTEARPRASGKEDAGHLGITLGMLVCHDALMKNDMLRLTATVIPAQWGKQASREAAARKAGIHNTRAIGHNAWIPAYAGMTTVGFRYLAIAIRLLQLTAATDYTHHMR
jgi:hypothetical protein